MLLGNRLIQLFDIWQYFNVNVQLGKRLSFFIASFFTLLKPFSSDVISCIVFILAVFGFMLKAIWWSSLGLILFFVAVRDFVCIVEVKHGSSLEKIQLGQRSCCWVARFVLWTFDFIAIFLEVRNVDFTFFLPSFSIFLSIEK